MEELALIQAICTQISCFHLLDKNGCPFFKYDYINQSELNQP